MRSAICGLLLTTCAIAADPAIADAVARISSVERRMPWLWSPAAEGLADIPYTYSQQLSRRILTRGGKEVPPAPGADGLSGWRTLQLERVPLDWGSFLRCVSQDGTSPCSKKWVQELERQTKGLDALTPEERARIDATREERRRRRRDFWDEPFARLPKGAHFGIELAKSADQHYFPLRISVRKQRGKAREIEESTVEFSNFRRFDAESKIQFGDPKEPDKP